MSESKKFTTKELDTIAAKNRIELLKETKETMTEEMRSLQEQEQKLVKELNEKYGTGTVDIASGEFIPAN